MKKQGAWMKWEQAKERNVTWKDMWKWNPQRIKFLSQLVYDVLSIQGCNASGGGLLGEREVGEEGGASFSRGRVNQQCSSHCGNRAPG